MYKKDKKFFIYKNGSYNGYEDGTLKNAKFTGRGKMAVDSSGIIYVADSHNNRIRFIDIENDRVGTLAGNGNDSFREGDLKNSSFREPWGIAIDDKGKIFATCYNRIFIIDSINNKVSNLTGKNEEGFEDGNLNEASFNSPSGIVIIKNGNIFVADTFNHAIRYIDMKKGQVTTITGDIKGDIDGTLKEARFSYPTDIAIDTDGIIYVVDANDKIRFIDIENDVVGTLAGTGERGFNDDLVGEAKFNIPMGITIDKRGQLFIADMNNQRIRVIDKDQTVVSTLLGSNDYTLETKDGDVQKTRIDKPSAIAIDNEDNILFCQKEQKIKMIKPKPGMMTKRAR